MTTWIVDQSGGGDATDITTAVGLASSGDTIQCLRGEYGEEVDDTGKDLYFEGDGLVVLQGGSSLADGFTLTGASVVNNFIIEGFTGKGIDGAILVQDCIVRDNNTGIYQAGTVIDCIVYNNTIGILESGCVFDNNVIDNTTGIKDWQICSSTIVYGGTTLFEATSDPGAVSDSVVYGGFTNYALIGATPITSLVDFKAEFGSNSAEEIDPEFLDAAKDLFVLRTDSNVCAWNARFCQAGRSIVYTGISALSNKSLFEFGEFTGATAYAAGTISGIGTFATGVLDLRESRGVLDLMLATSEDITSGDVIEKTADALDIEYRGSNTIFDKDDSVLAWNTIGRNKALTGTYRYWQFRFTIAGSAELYGIAIGVIKKHLNYTTPTWVVDEGIDTISVGGKGEIQITAYDRTDPSYNYRVYCKEATDVGLFDESNIYGEFEDQNFILSSQPDGSQFASSTTYYFGCRLISKEGVEETNVESVSMAYSFSPSLADIPVIRGVANERGSVTITLVDTPSDVSYGYTLILREHPNGFSEIIGTLTNAGEELSKTGFVPGTIERFMAMSISASGARSYPSEEISLLIIDTEIEPPDETVYS